MIIDPNIDELSMYEAMRSTARKRPGATAVYYQGKKISFRSLLRHADRTADILYHRLGVRPGDVIVISQPNIPEGLFLLYAVNKIGAVANMVHPYTPFNQMKQIMNFTNTRYAFLFEQRVAKEVERYRDLKDQVFVTRIEDSLPLFTKIIYHVFMNRGIRKTLGKWRGKFRGFTCLKSLRPTGKPIPIETGHARDTRLLLHSGSTTGDPKTICLSSYNFNFVSKKACEFLSASEKDPLGKFMLSVLPSFHGFGLSMTMHAPILNGWGTALMPKFSAKGTVKYMNHIRIYSICGVPTMYENLLKCDEFIHNRNLRYLHVSFCGGDSMPSSLEERWNRTMEENGSHSRIFEGYGLTEAVAVNCVNTYEHNRHLSLGHPASDVTVKILDEENREVPLGEIGEICLSSGAMMNGYFKDPELTRKAIVDGYLHTGDLGFMDADGFVFFKQRKKRVVKVSGVGVFPTEVERLVESVPGVEACCAIQIPDPRLQHALKVFVVAKFFDREGMINNIMDTCRKYLIRWAVPKEIEFRDELPKTLLGKIDFKALQQEEDEKRGVKKEQ